MSVSGFSGTLEDLARAIDRGDVDARSVSVHEVIRACFDELGRQGEPGLDDVGGLLAAASALVAAKARAILPPGRDEGEAQADPAVFGSEGEGEGEGADEDGEGNGNKALIAHLMEYRIFKEAVEELARRDEAWRAVFLRSSLPHGARGVLPPERVGLPDLIQALRRILEGIPEDEFTAIPADDLSIEEKMDSIIGRLRQRGKLLFRELFEGPVITRSEVIAVFLALLELIRLAKAVVRQDSHFGDILILPAAGAGGPGNGV
ncbi:MAG: segregation/condensation protein A [Bacillota bacterium]|nr:segregation/condensation protein A [Bacillota bacterium]